MDTVGHEATHHPTKIHRKEDGEVVEKEMAKEHRRVASPKGGKGGALGKGQGEGKKGQHPQEQWTSGSWERWSDQSWQTDADNVSWRQDDRYTAEWSSRASAAAEEFHHASVNCDFEFFFQSHRIFSAYPI